MFANAFDRRDFADRTAITFHGQEYSYGSIANYAAMIATGLQTTMGVKPGDRVAIHMVNSAEMVAALLACEWSGAVIVPIRWSESSHLVTDWCNYLSVAAVLTDERLITKFTKIDQINVRKIATPKALASEPDLSNYRRLEPAEPLLCVHTSGSTARPKPVMQSLAVLDQRAHVVVDYMGFQSNDVVCVVSDLSQGWGMHNLLTPPLSIGATALIFSQPEYDDAAIICEAAKHGATIVGSSPPRLRKLLHAARTAKQLPQLRFSLSSADKLPDDLAVEWQEVFGSPLLEAWGMSEANCSLWSRLGDHEIGTVGRPLPGIEARIVDANGSDVSDGKAGELWLKTPYGFSGYWPRSGWTSDWLATGDQFIRQAGRYKYIARNSHMLKRGGILVSPFEIEDALRRHSAVNACVVVGVASDEWGQDIEAFCELKTPVSAAELQEHAEQTCGIYMRPTRYWAVSVLPETSAGKVARNIERLRAVAKPIT